MIEAWFRAQDWEILGFQRMAWDSFLKGSSGLVHAPTGQGKTLAVWGGPLIAWGAETTPAHGARVLWITPMRALARDTLRALRRPVDDLGLAWSCAIRTGDTSARERAAMRDTLPNVLVTTPESLSLMLSHPNAKAKLERLGAVVVDEWHELLGSKRGVQTELCLARLRVWQPDLRVWGLSATLGNLDTAMRCLLGREGGHLIAADQGDGIEIECLIPEAIERFPWSGHLGLRLLPRVVEAIGSRRSSLLFTNTRSQCEIWHENLRMSGAPWADAVGIHHGSLDRRTRQLAERGIADGSLRCVVCTSSLDLGVDFAPVEQVLQVGSPKGVARLMQRAGRSGHRPGVPSRVVCVPTNALEILEFTAARNAVGRGAIEPREPIVKPLDVLAQHLVTCAAGGGFHEPDMLAEVRSTHSYRHLGDEEWGWVIEFVRHGGPTLRRYRQYRKVERAADGRLHVPSARVARAHRLAIGTITGRHLITVKSGNGRVHGHVEEWFLSRLSKGDAFLLGGRHIEVVRITADTVTVRDAKRKGAVATWMGGRMPLSTELASALLDLLGRPPEEPGHRACAPLLDIQAQWSRLPDHRHLLIEQTRSRHGEHAFVYLFAGRLVNEGVAALAAHRMTAASPLTIRVGANDYGFQLTARAGIHTDPDGWRARLRPENLADDIMDCLNVSEGARRRFRDIARVAGLLDAGPPGSRAATRRSLQTSASLLYEVFSKYDPDNLLLRQARKEVLENQLDHTRMRHALEGLRAKPIMVANTARLTPLAFPLWADQIQASLVSSVPVADRLAEMLGALERAADTRSPATMTPEILIEEADGGRTSEDVPPR